MKSFLLLCMSLVADFVFLGGTNSVMVISALILYSVFRQILLRKTVIRFAPHHLHRDTSFPVEHLRDNLAFQ